jgi:hypothetical protein
MPCAAEMCAMAVLGILELRGWSQRAGGDGASSSTRLIPCSSAVRWRAALDIVLVGSVVVAAGLHTPIQLTTGRPT